LYKPFNSELKPYTRFERVIFEEQEPESRIQNPVGRKSEFMVGSGWWHPREFHGIKGLINLGLKCVLKCFMAFLYSPLKDGLSNRLINNNYFQLSQGKKSAEYKVQSTERKIIA
jgi:hypothetical protein